MEKMYDSLNPQFVRQKKKFGEKNNNN